MMSIYDRITIDYPLPCGTGLEFQAHVDIADSHGDYYYIDASGRIWRDTVDMWMARPMRQRFSINDYNDDALEVYGGEMGEYAYILTFRDGKLVSWKVNELA